MTTNAWQNRIVGHGTEAPGELLANPRNWRRHPQPQQDALTQVLDRVGWVQDVIVNRTTGHLVDGHLRLDLARERGEESLPVVYVDLSEEEERLVLASLDPLAGMAVTDEEMLATLLGGIETEGALAAMLEGVSAGRRKKGGNTDPDAVPEPPEIPTAKTGDLWLLGKHRLLCGDSTSTEDVSRLMNGERAVLFATDPPYLVDYDGTNHPHAWNKPDGNKDWSEEYGVRWDEAKSETSGVLYEGFLRVAKEVAIDERAAWYCWHAGVRSGMVQEAWEKAGAFVHQQIIWVKNRPILTHGWYMWRHEPCFFGWIRGMKPTRVRDEFPHSVWELDTVAAGAKTEHPTSKPVRLFEIPMEQHTTSGGLCYEPFSGPGSQIIAAERLGRRCYAMELEPRYVDVAVRRWEEFTGETAVRAE